MSLPEGLLWHRLRIRPLGVKFRNQHPIGNLVADFYCANSRLVIEIDGIAHEMGDNLERDRRRDAWLRSQGYRIVRVLASDVLKDPDAVADGIVRLCMPEPPPSALHAATSPRGGDSSGVAC
ncbi:MAG: endonuclease domain-containing protein [Novosphingobium sp.]|uniref:endonuclease domain-containing protein n=1 Tax=Novosphingobium sp. TaxID=1874826 RepID=UPI0032B70578